MAIAGTTDLYITDKNGGKFFKTNCSTAYKDSEHRNLARHLASAECYPENYKFLDLETAEIIEVNNV